MSYSTRTTSPWRERVIRSEMRWATGRGSSAEVAVIASIGIDDPDAHGLSVDPVVARAPRPCGPGSRTAKYCHGARIACSATARSTSSSTIGVGDPDPADPFRA